MKYKMFTTYKMKKQLQYYMFSIILLTWKSHTYLCIDIQAESTSKNNTYIKRLTICTLKCGIMDNFCFFVFLQNMHIIYSASI